MLFFFLEAAKLNTPTPSSSFQIQTTAVLSALFQTFLPLSLGLCLSNLCYSHEASQGNGAAECL